MPVSTDGTRDWPREEPLASFATDKSEAVIQQFVGEYFQQSLNRLNKLTATAATHVTAARGPIAEMLQELRDHGRADDILDAQADLVR